MSSVRNIFIIKDLSDWGRAVAATPSYACAQRMARKVNRRFINEDDEHWDARINDAVDLVDVIQLYGEDI